MLWNFVIGDIRLSFRYFFNSVGRLYRDFFFIQFIRRIKTFNSFLLNVTFWVISSSITSFISSLLTLVTQVHAMKSYIELVSGRFFFFLRIQLITCKIFGFRISNWSDMSLSSDAILSFSNSESCHNILCYLASLYNLWCRPTVINIGR